MARPGAPLPPEKPPAPAPLPAPVTGTVKPLDIEPAPPVGGGTTWGGGTNGSGPSKTTKPRSGAPTVGDITGRFGPVAGVGGQLASGELQFGPWLGTSSRGRSLTLSMVPDASGDSAADGSSVDQAQSDLASDGARSPDGDDLEDSLSRAAKLTRPGASVGIDVSDRPSPLPVLFAGLSAVTGFALTLLGKRRWDRYSAIRGYELGHLPQ